MNVAATQAEQVLHSGRMADYEARLRAAPSPSRLPIEIGALLERAKNSEHARARLRLETSLLDDAKAQRASADERRIKIEERREQCRLDLQITTTYRPNLGAPGVDRVVIAERGEAGRGRLEREIAEFGEELAAIDARRLPILALARALQERQDACYRFIVSEKYQFIAPPKIGAGASLEAVRARITKARTELAENELRPRTLAEVKQDIVKQIDRELRAPNVARLFDRKNETPGIYFSGSTIAGGATLVNGLGFALWLHRDEIVARLCEQAEQRADEPRAISDQQLAKRHAELEADILAAERVEEWLVWGAMRDGVNVLPRGDADPRAILGCE